MRVLTSNNEGYDDDGQDEEKEQDGLGPASAIAVGEVLPHDVSRELHQRLPEEVHERVAFHVADVEHKRVVRHGVNHPAGSVSVTPRSTRPRLVFSASCPCIHHLI